MEIKGTIKSRSCKQIISDGSSQCSNCTNLIKIESFRKRAARVSHSRSAMSQNKQGPKLSKQSNTLLSESAKLRKLKAYRRMVENQRRKIFNLSSQLARSRASRLKMSEKSAEWLKEAMCRQSAIT